MTTREKAQELVHEMLGTTCLPMAQFNHGVEIVTKALDVARQEGRNAAANDLEKMIKGGGNAGRKDQPPEAL